ncbi:MAG: response regulator [Acidobacteriota bacterium]|nr:response regulator [Acidobacteriota bacterium]MDH3785431.1 response regulator [Acidobacteriota bacterium]
MSLEPTRVLVVEDNPINRKVALSMLGTLNCDCVEAHDGEQAIAAMRQAHYDIVFMDCQMPGTDGFEATRVIRIEEATAGRHTPVVALTANAMKGDRERCLDAGMDDYISKPARISDLKRALDQWVPARATDS